MLLTSADELQFPLQNAKLLKLNISLFLVSAKYMWIKFKVLERELP